MQLSLFTITACTHTTRENEKIHDLPNNSHPLLSLYSSPFFVTLTLILDDSFNSSSMRRESISQITHNKVIDGCDAEFHDALEEFPFFDASDSFQESDQSVSSSDTDSNNDEEATVTVISEHTHDSPSSPSSAGLRHRRLASPRSCIEVSQFQFFKNNPDGLRDFNPHGSTTVSPEKKYERSGSLKDNEKLNGKSTSTTVHLDSASKVRQLNDQTTDSNSVITSVNGDERINDESGTVDSPNYVQDLLFILAELVIKVIAYQTKFLASTITFPIWLMDNSYMLVTDPYGIIRQGRNHMLGNISGVWGIGHTGLKLITHLWFQNPESTWKLFSRIVWGLLWLAYCGFVLVCLLVPAFLLSGVMVKWIVEEPIQITEQLIFDYTRDTPMAFLPIISCPESSSLEHSEKSKIGSFVESRVIPFDHELQATVSLTLPESDYNRNLGIFQVRIDFLSDDGKLLASTRQPCMLQFRSEPIRLLSTFFMLAPLLTGYSSETQTLYIKFKGYTEKDIHTSCSRVVIEQRAEFARRGGFPEIYSASLKIESQLPFFKRMLWYWKGLIYMWIGTMMFLMELLFTLVCCTRIIFPGVHRVGGSSNNDASSGRR